MQELYSCVSVCVCGCDDNNKLQTWIKLVNGLHTDAISTCGKAEEPNKRNYYRLSTLPITTYSAHAHTHTHTPYIGHTWNRAPFFTSTFAVLFAAIVDVSVSLASLTKLHSVQAISRIECVCEGGSLYLAWNRLYYYYSHLSSIGKFANSNCHGSHYYLHWICTNSIYGVCVCVCPLDRFGDSNVELLAIVLLYSALHIKIILDM